MTVRILGLAALLLVAGCESPGGEAGGSATPADPRLATLSGEACPDVGEKAYFFWMEPRAAEPGDGITLQPYWTDNPGGYNDLPPGCIGDLKAYPEEAATFTRDESGLATATISESVQAGTRVRLDATYRGSHPIGGMVDVFSRDASPLVGVWRQDGADCPPESAVRELVFTGAGEMTVTWTPFEVYKDYWAAYTFDPESGAFSFEVEGGNQVPDDIMSDGTARLDGDRLILDDAFLGTPRQANDGCRGDFLR